jgi:hypothetical protein
MSTTPTHIWFLCQDGQRFIVETAQLTRPGSLPDGCWFRRVFAGLDPKVGTGPIIDPPTPLYIDAETKLPVYPLALPSYVLDAMLQGMRFMDMLPDLYRHMPSSIENRISLATWRKYLTDYGLDLVSVDDKGEGEEHKKRQKRETDDDTTTAKIREMPETQFLERVVRALADRIRAEHPRWQQFVLGMWIGPNSRPLDQLDIYLVSQHRPGGENFTFMLSVPGDPPMAPVDVAAVLGHGLRDIDKGVNYEIYSYLTKIFVKALNPGKPVRVYWNVHYRLPPDVIQDKITGWPLPAKLRDFTELGYDILKLEIHRVKE